MFHIICKRKENAYFVEGFLVGVCVWGGGGGGEIEAVKKRLREYSVAV